MDKLKGGSKGGLLDKSWRNGGVGLWLGALAIRHLLIGCNGI